MAKQVYGTIANLPWSTSAVANQDIILEDLGAVNNREESLLPNEQDDIVSMVLHRPIKELSSNFAIKGTTHWGLDAVVGSVITIVDAEFAGDYIVTGNSRTKRRADFMVGTITMKFYGAGFTVQTTTTTTSA